MSHSADTASDGIRQSPRGESVTVPTFGPSGRQERLNCCVKKRRIKVVSHFFDACNAINPYVTGMQGYLLLGVLPFNLIKGAILTAITMLAYKKLS